MGHSGYPPGFDGAYPPDYSTWGYFPPANVLVARYQGVSIC